jgi:hypothetical protein
MISLCNETRWCKLLTLFYMCATSLHNKLLDSLAHMCCVLIWCKILDLMKITSSPIFEVLKSPYPFCTRITLDCSSWYSLVFAQLFEFSKNHRFWFSKYFRIRKQLIISELSRILFYLKISFISDIL